MLHDFLEQFQKEMEFTAPLGTRETGIYSFMLGDTEIQIVNEAPKGFRLSATLGPIPLDHQEALMTHMLRANLFGQATLGAFLGLNEKGTKALLQRVCDEAKNYQEFKIAIEEFLNAVDFWTKEIKNYPSQP
jgi:hypothetical protein